MIAALALAALSLIPVHGVVLDMLRDGSAIVRTDARHADASRAHTALRPAAARRVRSPARTSTRSWTRVAPAGAARRRRGGTVRARPSGRREGRSRRARRHAAAGHARRPRAARPSSSIAPFGQDAAALVRLHALPGPDALSGDQRRSSHTCSRTSIPRVSRSRRSRSIRSTIRPRCCARYGGRATAPGARAGRFLTATGSTIQRLLNAFEISSMRVSTSNFLHDDRLFIVAPDGRVAYVVETADWDPRAVVAEASGRLGAGRQSVRAFQARARRQRRRDLRRQPVRRDRAARAVAVRDPHGRRAGGLWVVARVLWPPVSS